MSVAEFKNAPPLYGWVIAKAAAIVAFGAGYLVIDLGFMGAAGVSVVVWLIVGLIFTVAEAPQGAARVVRPDPVAAAQPVAAALVPVVEMAPVVDMAPTTVTPIPAPEIAAVAAPVAIAAAEPIVASPAAQPVALAETKPAALSGPIGTADDLKQINGVGPVLEAKLNNLGIYHFWQIARWHDAEVAWVDGFLNFKGRIGRDNWITQALTLAEASPARPPL